MIPKHGTCRTSVGPAFTASLGQDNLSRYLARSKSRLPGLEVTLLPDTVRADIPVSALGLSTTAELSGFLRPDPDDPSRLDFVASGAQLGNVRVPAGLVTWPLTPSIRCSTYPLLKRRFPSLTPE